MYENYVASPGLGARTTLLPPPSFIRDAVLALDHSFRVIGCDSAAPSMFGCPRQQLVGSHVSQLIPSIAWPTQFLQESPGEEHWGHLRFSRIGLEACSADGSRFSITASLLQDADGNLLLRIRSLNA